MKKYTVIFQVFDKYYNIVAIIEGHHEELTHLTLTLHIEAEDLHKAYVLASSILAEKAQRKAEEV